MNKNLAPFVCAALLIGASATAQQKTGVDTTRIEQAINESWKGATAEWQARLVQDETMKACTEHRNAPPTTIANAIVAREKATIVYPADGRFLGNWKKGERLAQSGYGLRFTDYPPASENGGNCYACHQLDRKELSYGTLGPSLLEYGKIRNYSEAEVKTAYERIYNPQAHIPCANMPRFGTNKVLTVEQIKDLVALLMDPESPVNK
jgi:L-cysteine S-thiosulfotransferase